MSNEDDAADLWPDSRDPTKAKRLAAFRTRSSADLALETWEKFPQLGLERIRVLGGWLYRHSAPDGTGEHLRHAPIAPLTFVPDPPRVVYAAPPSAYGPSR